MIIDWQTSAYGYRTPYYGIGFIENWLEQGSVGYTPDGNAVYVPSERKIFKPSARMTFEPSERETYKPSPYGNLI